MSRCDELMALLQDALAWRCETLPDSTTLLVGTDRCFADGDGVSLFVRHGTDGGLTVSDGGQVTGRLELAGIDWQNESTRAGRAWEQIRRAYGVEETRGRIYLRGDASRAPLMLGQIADAALAFDSLTAMGIERTVY